ncbi:LacI family DNA-binding transcriptional regulator [Consotaella salsifontis]|uniref:LacI family DNA-binding transcriptional regulator n=1 Tax=Consotaella salsifontis TaxID=1365950 RepID=UPI001FD97E69|nr:LacI family DNA-binding transcriptional regulator [Consotaella salsifontis]
MKRVTVHDVAAEAGVSLATVDRVLNGRSGVTTATAARVKDAVERLNYRRDLFAASLATGREYRFQFVVPSGNANTFMGNLGRAVEEEAERLAEQRILVSVDHYVAFDEVSLAERLAAIDTERVRGVAVVAVDTPRVKEAVDALVLAGVKVVTIVSDVIPSLRSHTIAINNICAGRVAGTLIGRFLGGREGEVALVSGSMALRDHVERRIGFEQVLLRDFPHLQILSPSEGRDDSGVTRPLMRRMLHDHPRLIGLYSIGAGNRGIIDAMEESGRARDIVAVAHELTIHSRQALISGSFDAVIHQNVTAEVAAAVRVLKALCDGQADVVQPGIPIDIFFRDNLP